MRKKSCQKNWPRFPIPCGELQVNFCKTAKCEMFGVLPEDSIGETVDHSNSNDNKSQHTRNHRVYKTSGSGKNESSIVCKTCVAERNSGDNRKVSSMMKSNLAVVEEYERISDYLWIHKPCCTNIECISNSDVEIEPKSKKRGLTGAGNQRYQCLHCNKSFTDSDGSRPQLRSEINLRLFDLLVSKVPLRKIAKVLHISMRTVYIKIDFIHKQCLEFVADRERRLIEGKVKIDRLYLSTDRQVQITNWIKRDDKRNTELYGIGTSCLKSSYVFAFNFNFDGTTLQESIEAAAFEFNDNEKPKHHRVTARVWLEQEYEDAVENSNKRPSLSRSNLVNSTAIKAEQEADLNDNLSSEDFDNTTRLPSKGVLVHNEYTMMGHFMLLKTLLKHVDKTRFYMDQDTGMKNAYLSIFRGEIIDGDSDGFIVSSEKQATVDERRAAVNQTNRLIKERTGVPRTQLSNREFRDVVNEMIIENMAELEVMPKSNEEWLTYPIGTNPEPSKIVAAVTDIYKYGELHQANLYRKASLHSIDRFFMRIRRDINLFERPFHSATNSSRIWNGYSAYDPTMLTKLGDIYRVYYNYVNTGVKRITPAMKLGLAQGVVTTEKILYFGKYKERVD